MFGGKRGSVGRAEKQARNQSRLLLWFGLMLLGISMSMAGKFGFGLGKELPDKIGNAVFYVLADAVGAVLMVTVGLLFARRMHAWGCFAALALVACIGFSITSIFGFQAANRVAISEGKKAAISRAEERLQWLRGGVVDKSLAKERTSFLSEEREQFNAMQSMDVTPDAQAKELAKLLGIEPDVAQRGMNIAGSGFILFLQFVCLSLSSFLRQRVEPEIAAQEAAISITNPRQLSANNSDKTNEPDKWVGYNHAHAFADLRVLLEKGLDLTARGAISNLAKRWGWSPQRVRRWLSEQPEFNLPPPRKRTRQASPMANGNGRVHAA
jgi:hypothetical protein